MLFARGRGKKKRIKKAGGRERCFSFRQPSAQNYAPLLGVRGRLYSQGIGDICSLLLSPQTTPAWRAAFLENGWPETRSPEAELSKDSVQTALLLLAGLLLLLLALFPFWPVGKIWRFFGFGVFRHDSLRFRSSFYLCYYLSSPKNESTASSGDGVTSLPFISPSHVRNP